MKIEIKAGKAPLANSTSISVVEEMEEMDGIKEVWEMNGQYLEMDLLWGQREREGQGQAQSFWHEHLGEPRPNP